MSDFLAGFGVGEGDLSPQIDDVVYPPAVQGRVAHIDADFLAYQVSAESKDELDGLKPRKTLEDMQHNAREAALHLMRAAASTEYVCHITPSGSNKGGRAAQAVQQEYQANRADKEKPEHLDIIRAFIGQELNGAVHLDQEADDGMAQANYNAEDPNLSIIVSRDKDLRMVPGWHYNFDTGENLNVIDVFGSLRLDDSKSSKAVKGWGTAFFWAQCLMGDTADHIKGAPAIPGSVHCEYMPTKTYLKDVAYLPAQTTDAKRGFLQQKIDAALGKTKPCGHVSTYEILKDVGNDRDAFELVRGIWQKLETEHGYEFKHWKTDVTVTATQALLGDMQLLWMRRNKNPRDVVEWLRTFMV